jgi:hypothetical protein
MGDAPRRAVETAEIEMTADGHHLEKAAQPVHGRAMSTHISETNEHIVDVAEH